MSLTTLNGAINSSVTSITVHDAVPASPSTFFTLIDSELIHVASVSSETWTTTRAAYSTTAASHTDNTPVYRVEAIIPTAQGVTVLYINDSGIQVNKFIQTYSSGSGAPLDYGSFDISGFADFESAPQQMIPAVVGLTACLSSPPLVVAAGESIDSFVLFGGASTDIAFTYAEVTIGNAAGSQVLCVGTGDTITVPAGTQHDLLESELSVNGNHGSDLSLFDIGSGIAGIKSTAGGTFIVTMLVST
jgi:hypothetical protein